MNNFTKVIIALLLMLTLGLILLCFNTTVISATVLLGFTFLGFCLAPAIADFMEN